MADQAVVSAGNFVTAILLARAIAPSEYGIFALIYALMLFMVSVHSALVAYGLSLQGAAGTDSER
jgi:O-antigen/teichoic acid export membrane protein